MEIPQPESDNGREGIPTSPIGSSTTTPYSREQMVSHATKVLMEHYQAGQVDILDAMLLAIRTTDMKVWGEEDIRILRYRCAKTV